ncbi:DNA-3-methyladenine glycosylase family protein [Patescibacteria group bacterium]
MKANKINAHFRKADPVIYKIMPGMEINQLPKPKNSNTYFKKLCGEIIAQQLAGKVAAAITNRFYNLFERKRVTPTKVLAISEQKLRNIGMSWAKARYVRDLAQKVKDREVRLNNLHNLDDELVIEELTKVKGIGNWTAEMFLIFTLGREDVFSHGDLGLRKALQKLYGFKDKPSEKQINKVVDKWSPYKSYGCLVLWKSIDS